MSFLTPSPSRFADRLDVVEAPVVERRWKGMLYISRSPGKTEIRTVRGVVANAITRISVLCL